MKQMESTPSSSSYQPDSQQSDLVSLSAIQKAMFKSMTKSLSIPHFGYSDEVNMNALSQFKDEINALANAGVKVSYMPFFIKALSLALNEYPILNATLVNSAAKDGKEVDIANVKIQYRHFHNVGIAMDTPQG